MSTWKTKDGTVLKISEMDDFHITNCLLLIRKLAIREAARKVVSMYYGGRLPGDAIPGEEEFKGWWQGMAFNTESWQGLYDEAKNRGLDLRSLEDDSEAYGMLHVFLTKEADKMDKMKPKPKKIDIDKFKLKKFNV